MDFLFVGGTGTISSSITALAVQQGHNVTLINRGQQKTTPPGGVRTIVADINDERAVAAALGNQEFSAVVDFIAYGPEHLERDARLFRNRTAQFVFISSASAYQKPPRDYPITEATPLENPYWEYSRKKIAGENRLRELAAAGGLPWTIVRPSHTYNERKVPVGLHGKKGSWQVLQRILDGKPVIVHGDGSALWTLTYSGDFARGFCGLLGNNAAMGKAVHLTTDEARTWNYIYETIAAALQRPLRKVYATSEYLAEHGKEYDFRGSLFGDKANCAVFDNSLLKRLVPGFHAEVPIAEGLRRAVDFVLAHPELRVPDPEFDAWCDKIAAAQG